MNDKLDVTDVNRISIKNFLKKVFLVIFILIKEKSVVKIYFRNITENVNVEMGIF